MQVEINNQNLVSLPLLGHMIIGSDEICDVVLEGEKSSLGKTCSIIYDKSACILEVFDESIVRINQLLIKERAIIHPGDTISIGENSLRLINENALPKACNAPFKLIDSKDHSNHLVTSVSGLRSFNQNSFGELAIVGDQNSYTHKVLSENDTAFSVSYIDNNLTLLCQKDKHIFINGNKADYVILKNGDYITTGAAKYCVESPGTSSFSKYSPSHPRNIQLSEEYFIDINSDKKDKKSFIKNNIWWLSLLAGLSIIAIILVILKNN